METYILKNDIKIFYIEASSFPEGITKAHETLHRLSEDVKNRTCYGVSRPGSNGVIEYKAGTTEAYEGEGAALGCKTLLIKAGTYTGMDIKNYSTRPERIGEAFRQILEEPGLDPQGYCVEVYDNASDVRCMVRLK